METMLLVSLLINKKLLLSWKFFNYVILLNLPGSKKLWRYNFWLRCHQLFFVFLRLKFVSLMSQAFGQSFVYVAYLHLCHKKYNNHYFENIWSEKKKTYIYIFGVGGGEERGGGGRGRIAIFVKVISWLVLKFDWFNKPCIYFEV